MVHRRRECEDLQNKSRKLENEKKDLELSIAEKDQGLLNQREEHEKQAQAMTSRIEKKVKIVEEQISCLSEERKEKESKRAGEETIFKKELNRAKDLLKQYREKIEAINKVVVELGSELKMMKAIGDTSAVRATRVTRAAKAIRLTRATKVIRATRSTRTTNKQEKVGNLSIQVEQYLPQIEALTEENVMLRKELEKNENALNEGFRENKTLSDKYGILKSRLRKVLDGM